MRLHASPAPGKTGSGALGSMPSASQRAAHAGDGAGQPHGGMKTKKEADSTACRKNVTKKQQTKDGTATILRFFCRCPKMPMRSYFSPAKLSRLASCDTLLPSPGVKRRGHDIRGLTRTPFCEMWGKSERCRTPQEHLLPLLYARNKTLSRGLICQPEQKQPAYRRCIREYDR